MKICKKCKNKFPINIIIDNKKRNVCGRKYCLDCSPFGSHNTSSRLETSTGDRLKDRKRWSKYNSEYVLQQRQKHKLKLFEYKGAKCEKCGYNKPIMGAYEFHHLDPTKKSYTISSTHRSWDIAKAEVDKCQLLCARCHAEIHASLQIKK